VYRYIREAVDVLAPLAPTLEQAVSTAATKAFVILDGTLLPIDRIAADRPFCSGKHKKHANRAIPVPRQQDPKSLDPGQPRLTAETVESPERGNAHAGFGERHAETDRWRRRHRAAGRLNHHPSDATAGPSSCPPPVQQAETARKSN